MGDFLKSNKYLQEKSSIFSLFASKIDVDFFFGIFGERSQNTPTFDFRSFRTSPQNIVRMAANRWESDGESSDDDDDDLPKRKKRCLMLAAAGSIAQDTR